MFSWGRGTFGQLGTGDFNNSSTPKEVEFKEPVKVVSVAAGGNHSFFLTDNGKLLSCGKGAHGQTGQKKSINLAFPTTIKYLDNKFV